MSTANWFAANAPATPPPAPSAPAGGDWFTQHAPAATPGSQPATLPSPAHDAQSADLAANTNGEGTYQMKNPQGLTVAVPYSNVHRALDQGHLFADKGTLQQYARDHAADPLSEDRVDQWMDKHPYLRLTPPALALSALEGAGTGALKTWTGADRTPTSRLETEEQLAASTPTRGPQQAAGEVGESLAEFFTGDELGTMLGKVGTGLGITDKLKAMTGLAQTIEKYPMVAKLLKIGASAAKQGTIAGTQTYLKSGDPAAALTSGAETAVAAPVLSEAIAGASKRIGNVLSRLTPEGQTAIKAASPAVKGAEQYGQKMGEIIKPHLDAVNAAGGEGAVIPERTVERTTPFVDERGSPLTRTETVPGKTTAAIPKIDVNEALSRTGDASRARQELKDGLNSVQAQMDGDTQGGYSKARDAMHEAEEQAQSGKPQDLAYYEQKQHALDQLIADSGAKPEMKDALRNGWRQYYGLAKAQRILDASLEGLPGDTKASYQNRGINGKKLLGGLSTWIRDPKVGRQGVAQALGGEERLKSLEAIGRATSTNAGRASVNEVARFVAKSLAGAVGAKAGYASAGWVGGSVGAKIGWEAPTVAANATSKVFKAMMAKPAIANLIIYAADYGAKPENYGPFIATIIQKWETQAARQQIANEATH